MTCLNQWTTKHLNWLGIAVFRLNNKQATGSVRARKE